MSGRDTDTSDTDFDTDKRNDISFLDQDSSSIKKKKKRPTKKKTAGTDTDTSKKSRKPRTVKTYSPETIKEKQSRKQANDILRRTGFTQKRGKRDSAYIEAERQHLSDHDFVLYKRPVSTATDTGSVRLSGLDTITDKSSVRPGVSRPDPVSALDTITDKSPGVSIRPDPVSALDTISEHSLDLSGVELEQSSTETKNDEPVYFYDLPPRPPKSILPSHRRRTEDMASSVRPSQRRSYSYKNIAFQHLYDKWKKESTSRTHDSDLSHDNMHKNCICDDIEVQTTTSPDRLQHDLLDIFIQHSNRFYYYLNNKWNNNIQTWRLFPVTYNNTWKTVFFIGHNDTFHDSEFTDDIFGVVIELTDLWCGVLPSTKRPINVFVEVTSTHDFLANKRVRSSCVNIVPSDFRNDKGSLLCRKNRKHVHVLQHIDDLLSFHDHTVSVQTHTRRILDALFSNNPAIVQMTYDTPFQNAPNQTLDYLGSIRDAMNTDIVLFGDKLCTYPYSLTELASFYRHMQHLAGGILYIMNGLHKSLQSQEHQDIKWLKTQFAQLLNHINVLFLIPQIMNPTIFFSVVWYNNTNVLYIENFLDNLYNKQHSSRRV